MYNCRNLFDLLNNKSHTSMRHECVTCNFTAEKNPYNYVLSTKIDIFEKRKK